MSKHRVTLGFNSKKIIPGHIKISRILRRRKYLKKGGGMDATIPSSWHMYRSLC
jgi:hypothetical protein